MRSLSDDLHLQRTVLVLDDESRFRELLRIGLELEGYRVVEAASLAQARAVMHEDFDGVVLDRQVTDGDGLDLLDELRTRVPVERIVIHSTRDADDAVRRSGVRAVAKGDVEAILDAIGGAVVDGSAPVPPPSDGGHPGAATARRQAAELVSSWRLLCRWDPSLPPDAEPPIAESVVAAVADAMDRPQPLGWGLDPALDAVAQAFALNAPDVTSALAQLVCLREACERVVIAETPADAREEARRRQHMVIDRMMLGVGDIAVRRLAEQAETDPLTGLGNRRAFERDLHRQVAVSTRHGTPITVVVLDVDGLKAVNDASGHSAGDDVLRTVATALGSVVRAEDGTYRIGGDEFALILVGAARIDTERLCRRLTDAGCPSVSLGAAGVPDDPATNLVALADQRLYASRRRARVSSAS